MDIHEYQAKELLAGFGVAIPRGGVAYSPEQAVYRASEIGGARWAVKAQIHSGARGKAGGIKLCGSEDEVRTGGQGAAGQAAGDAPDRPRGPGGAPALRRGRGADRARDLPRPRARPEERADHGRRLAAGRHGDRGDRRRRRPIRSSARWSSPRSGMTAFQAREIAFGLGLDAGAGEPRGHHAARRLPRVPRSRRHDGGDQPAGRDRRRRSCWRSTAR